MNCMILSHGVTISPLTHLNGLIPIRLAESFPPSNKRQTLLMQVAAVSPKYL